ncbi:MAG: helix-turn-helix domain-containing protein [Alphaproteobacteria bacterium]
MTIKNEAARLVKSYRKKQKITQEELAFRSDIPYRTIQDIEGGLREPRFDTVFKLAKGFKIHHSELVDPIFSAWAQDHQDEKQ